MAAEVEQGLGALAAEAIQEAGAEAVMGVDRWEAATARALGVAAKAAVQDL